MSRRDRILSLAIGPKCKNKKESLPVPITNSNFTSKSTRKTSTATSSEKNIIITNIDDLWSRPYDYNDFPNIFDLNNEYNNFFETAVDIDLSLFNVQNSTARGTITRKSLICFESLDPSSEEEDRISPSVSNAKQYFGDSDDSVKDKNYSPKIFDSDSDSSPDIPSKIVVQADVHYNTPAKRSESLQPNSSVLLSANVISIAEDNDSRMSSEVINMTFINQIQNEDINEQNILNDETGDWLLPQDEIEDSGKGFTKSGLPRKRRHFDTSLEERKKLKKLEQQENLSVKPPCGINCRKKCTTYFTEAMRVEINKRYVRLDSWESRGLFIKGMVNPQEIKSRTVKKNDDDKEKRNISYHYHLFANKVKVNVCKTFFLTTLGYHKNNDRRVHNALENHIDQQKDRRGSFIRKNLIDKNQIREHINSFGPAISHYRREHAPKKLYLPSDITITLMYNLYLSKYPGIKVSYDVYRVIVKKMNISFACLGNEECEVCALLKPHFNKNECSTDCEKCIYFQKHREKYKECRIEYKADVKRAESELEIIYYSVDLQKVILLPRMQQYKSAIFSTRLVTFNESFVPLGPTTNLNVPFAAVWNESVSGRNQEDIISAFRAFFINKRDAKHIVLWADNCAAQNKNWALMSFLVNFVNSNITATESITIRYFEPGHTFMSADHIHHQVEMSMDHMKKIYDYDDFIDCVRKSNSRKNYVYVMNASDFYNYNDMASQHKLKNNEPRVYLKDIITVKAEKGDFDLKYKRSFKELWQTLNFLQVKIVKTRCFPSVSAKLEPRGIRAERKAEIISKLVPLMPENRQLFWKNLPISDASNLMAEY